MQTILKQCRTTLIDKRQKLSYNSACNSLNPIHFVDHARILQESHSFTCMLYMYTYIHIVHIYIVKYTCILYMFHSTRYSLAMVT